MRSSTSNSEWLKTWLLALGLAAGFLGSWEGALRVLGHKPTAMDSPALWSYWRKQAVGDKVVVVLGDSRPQLGWSNAACEQALPGYQPIQLAIGGHSYFAAALRDLAEEEQFRGIVLVCTTERGFIRPPRDAQSQYVACYHRQGGNLNAELNLDISCFLHRRLALLHPALKLDELAIHVVKYRTLPPLFYLDTSTTRNSAANYALADLSAARRLNIQRNVAKERLSPCEWLSQAMELEPYVRAIQDRGGHVAYIRFPTTGELWRMNRVSNPKDLYWDALAARTRAICVHFRDYPTLSRYPCPDFSHLDGKDAGPFTCDLIQILRKKGLFDSYCAH